MYNIVVFASGSGSNALNLIRHFNGQGFAEVKAVFCNKKNAGVLEKAQQAGVPTRVFNRGDYYETDTVIQEVAAYKPDIIVLAGFLWLVPESFIHAFEGKIINLHPSLLPKFGGKGMYGHFVHEAVLAAGEPRTGISVHLVNAEFDKGEIIYQDSFEILPGSSVSDIESQIHQLEHIGLPIAVEQFLSKRKI
ncbi:MAG: phosphoribosylglycinamide formyltransferase [Bacteroidetes bacterium]|nr:phosphoribosylglycinamide formyltransferase [Bacteroidota bacterium]